VPACVCVGAVCSADLRLLQTAMGHTSITVTAHTYADLFDDELDDIAAALDSLGDFQNGGK
jgi:integrase